MEKLWEYWGNAMVFYPTFRRIDLLLKWQIDHSKDDFADNDDSKTKQQDKGLWGCTADAQLKKYENSTKSMNGS